MEIKKTKSDDLVKDRHGREEEKQVRKRGIRETSELVRHRSPDLIYQQEGEDNLSNQARVCQSSAC